MRSRLRSLTSALSQLREAVDPRADVSPPAPETVEPVTVPEFDDPDELSAAELQDLKRALADELERASFTSDSNKR